MHGSGKEVGSIVWEWVWKRQKKVMTVFWHNLLILASNNIILICFKLRQLLCCMHEFVLSVDMNVVLWTVTLDPGGDECKLD